MPSPNSRLQTANRTPSQRLKVLMSAYACEPGKGSEPGVGWNMATEMAKHHEVWVLTRANNRQVIERELAKYPVNGLHFIYYDLPKWACWWKKGGRGVQLYYYLWQRFSWRTIKGVHRENQFDLTHHVTFGKYWVPSMLPRLPIPFVWGTVGGGESLPRSFMQDLNRREIVFEQVRRLARWVGEHDPAVRLTARRSAIALASTDETAKRLKGLGAEQVKVIPQCALSETETEHLQTLPDPSRDAFRFISMGRPLHWKGFYLGIKAFAGANLPNAVYWIIANGQGRQRLETLAKELGVAEKVRFFDKQPSLTDVYDLLSQCHVLVHPALHEAFGNVVLEAMASGRPALTLDLGGPALQVRGGGGLAAPSFSPQQAVDELAQHMRRIASDEKLYHRLSAEASMQVERGMTWRTRSTEINTVYQLVLADENHPGS